MFNYEFVAVPTKLVRSVDEGDIVCHAGELQSGDLTTHRIVDNFETLGVPVETYD